MLSTLFYFFQNSFHAMIIILAFLLKYRNICLSVGNSLNDEQCNECSLEGCIDLNDFANLDFEEVSKITVLNNLIINFQTDSIVFSNRDVSTLINISDNNVSHLNISTFTENALITIMSDIDEDYPRITFEAENNVIYDFQGSISNFPADFYSFSNVKILAQGNVCINGTFEIKSDCFINFSANHDDINKIDFTIEKIFLEENSTIFLMSSIYNLNIENIAFCSEEDSLPLRYQISSYGLSYVNIRNYPFHNFINISIIPDELTSQEIDDLLAISDFIILTLPSSAAFETIEAELFLPDDPGIFGFWNDASIFELLQEKNNYHIILNSSLVSDIENSLCYSIYNNCPSSFTLIRSSSVSSLINKYVPSYTKFLKILLLSSLPNDYLSLHELPQKITLYVSSNAANNFYPRIYLQSNSSSSSGSVFVFHNVHLVCEDDEYNEIPFQIADYFIAVNCRIEYLENTTLIFSGAFTSSIQFFTSLPIGSIDNAKLVHIMNCSTNLVKVTYGSDSIIITAIDSSGLNTDIPISDNISDIIFDLNTECSLTLATLSPSQGKHGLMFNGDGTISFESSYDYKYPDLSMYKLLRGNIKITLFDGFMPNFYVGQEASPYYTLPNTFSGHLATTLMNTEIPIKVKSIDLSANSTISINSIIYVDNLELSETVTAIISSTKVNSRLTLKRGSHLSTETDCYIDVNDAVVILEWRNNALPLLSVNSFGENIPKIIIMSLDIQDPTFIDVSSYFTNYYFTFIKIIEGIHTDECEQWINKTHFKSVIPYFDDSNSSISLLCKRRIESKNISDIMFYINMKYPNTLPTPSETPSSGFSKANCTYIICIVIIAYIGCAIGIFILFYLIKKRRYSYRWHHNTTSMMHTSDSMISESSDF